MKQQRNKSIKITSRAFQNLFWYLYGNCANKTPQKTNMSHSSAILQPCTFKPLEKKQINDKSSSYLTWDLTDPDCSQHLLELAQGFGKVKGDDFESNQTQISHTLSLSELSPSWKRCSNALLSYFISQPHAEQPRLHKTCPSYLEDSSCDFSFPLRYPKVDCLLPPPILHIK